LNIKGVLQSSSELSAIVNPEYSDAYLILNGNLWYVYTYIESTDALGWQLYSRNFPYIFNRTQHWEGLKLFENIDFNVNTHFGTIPAPKFVADNHHNGNRIMRIPHINKPAHLIHKYETYNNKWKDLALLFYRGLQASSDPSEPFPLASPENYNNNEKIGNYTLAWDGEDGLFEQFHKPKFNFLKNSTLFKFVPNIPEHRLMNIDIIRKYYSNNIVFYFKKIEFTISGSTIKSPKAEAYKL
jgi:hypothetical protein